MRKVLILAMVICAGLAVLLTGCGGGSGCIDGKQPGLYLSASPASVEANGSEQITLTASGLDANCKPIAAGVMVDMRLANQAAENPGDNSDLVGQFSGGGVSASVPMTNLGARTTLTSSVAGTASVTAGATIDGEYMSAIPVSVTFLSQPVDRCSISLAADPPSIPSDGVSTSTITATMVAYDGQPVADGVDVSFTTSLGVFTSTTDTTAVISSSNGQAVATLRSEDLDENQVARVTASFNCDDPLNTEKNNTQDVLFNAGGDQAFVTLNASGNEVLADGNSSVSLTAEVFMPDGTRAGAGEVVSFLTDLGEFAEAPAGSPRSFDVVTDADGRAFATFVGGIEGGTAQITASVYIADQNVYATVNVNVRQVGFVEFIEAEPEKLGVRGSGKNETSRLTFAVKDTNNQPFPNVLVEFSHSLAPGVTLEPLSAQTDGNGEVTTTLKSGNIATSVTVTAQAIVGEVQLEADSPALAIVGAKPNARFLTFSCEEFNVGGMILDNVQTDCSVLLADRYTNKIGFATNVVFMTEAGHITPSAVTIEDGDDMGSTVVSIRSGEPRPKDVTPMIDPAEPYIQGGAYTHNPRDGLLTIVAATTGEEEFNDLNGNGNYDAGEPYVDLGEPFIDADDDGERGPAEQFLDANGNNLYDGPNGQWDGDTLIWGRTWMMWTGDVYSSPMAPDCGAQYRYSGLCGEVLMPPNDNPRSFNLAKGSSRAFFWEVKDINLNVINSSLTANMNVDGKGSLGSTNPPLSFNAPDSLGIGITVRKVSDKVSLQPCTDNDPVCYYATEVSGFSGGFGGFGIVEGAPATDTQPPEDGTVELIVNYRQSPSDGQNFSTGDVILGVFQ